MSEKTFSDMMKRLEEIVDVLEKGNSSLEESLALFEEGSSLVKSCNDKLNEAKIKITEISEPGGEKCDG